MVKRIRSFLLFLIVALLLVILAAAWDALEWLPEWAPVVSRWLDERLFFVIVLSVILALLSFSFLFWLLIWKLPQWQVTYVFNAKDRLDLELKSRQISLQMVGLVGELIGGVALLGSFYFTATTLRISQETLRTTQQGQITERFTKAIAYLGDKERLMIRLGGIYALERIARDSEYDYELVIGVCSGYV
jgi:hypothetical protein